MKHISEVYEEISTNNRGGTRKSRYTSFEPGEFGKWILGGMRNAHTVEEYTAYGNILTVIDYNDRYRHHSVRTTQELLDKLEEMSGRSIDVSFLDNRQVYRPPSRQRGKTFDFNVLDQYFVLYSENGYFVKRSSRKFWCARGLYGIPENAKRFKSEQDAQKYLERTAHFSEGIPLRFNA